MFPAERLVSGLVFRCVGCFFSGFSNLARAIGKPPFRRSPHRNPTGWKLALVCVVLRACLCVCDDACVWRSAEANGGRSYAEGVLCVRACVRVCVVLVLRVCVKCVRACACV
jgi:hypothetical protein